MLGISIGLTSLGWGVWRWLTPNVPAGFVLLSDADGALLADDDGTLLMEEE